MDSALVHFWADSVRSLLVATGALMIWWGRLKPAQSRLLDGCISILVAFVLFSMIIYMLKKVLIWLWKVSRADPDE